MGHLRAQAGEGAGQNVTSSAAWDGQCDPAARAREGCKATVPGKGNTGQRDNADDRAEP